MDKKMLALAIITFVKWADNLSEVKELESYDNAMHNIVNDESYKDDLKLTRSAYLWAKGELNG